MKSGDSREGSGFGSSHPWLRALAEAPPVWLDSDELPRGTIIAGRYEIVRALGRGGMGVVYLARDPELDRDVALKLHLRFEGERGLHRLEEEARTLAGLNHPNIVKIYGLVRADPRLFVAMEYIATGDARRWAKQTQRSFDEVMAVYLGAARGLAAAHEAGIVHADFKPDNVLVGEGGRARIIDFGLGLDRSSGATPAGSPSPSASVIAGQSWVGTKRYMAPEQSRGMIGPAADQFSFCVAMAEALFGARPRAGWSATDLVEAAATRAPDPASARHWAAARILAVGLRSDPASRHANMLAVVAALEGIGAPPRRWIWPAVATGIAALALASWPRGDACGADDVDLAEAYAGRDRPRLEAAWSEHRARAQLFPTTDARLHAYAERLTHAYARSCESGAPASMRRCLDARRDHFDAAVAVLTDGDPDVLARAPAVVGQLESIDACERIEEGSAPTPEDAAAAAEVSVIRSLLVKSGALRAADRLQESLEHARGAQTRADALDFAPLQAEVWLALGRSELAMGRDADALEHLEAAYFSAKAARRDALAFDVALEIVQGMGAQPQVREAWLAHAEAHTPAGGRAKLDFGRATIATATNDYEAAARSLRAALQRVEDGSNLQVELLGYLGEIEIRLDHVEAGLAHLNDALARSKANRGEMSLQYADLLDRRSMARLAAAEPELALEDKQQAREIAFTLLGPDHGETLELDSSLATAYFELGQHAKALEILTRVRDARRRALGPEHRLVAFDHLNLGNAQIMMQQWTEAEATLREALRLFESGWGGDVDIAYTLQSLGSAVSARDPKLAAEHVERAVAALERGLGEEHQDTVKARLTLASALVDADRATEAIALLEAQLARLRDRNEGRSGAIVEGLYVLAWAHLSREDEAAAARAAEDGLAALDRTPSREYMRGLLAFTAGQARFGMGERQRGVELVRQAKATCNDPSEPCAVDMNHVNAWLATNADQG